MENNNELSTVENYKATLESKEQEIIDLVESAKGLKIKDFKDKEGFKICDNKRKQLKAKRALCFNIIKDGKAPILEAARWFDSKKKWVTDVISPEENRLNDEVDSYKRQVQEEKERIETEKKEAARAKASELIDFGFTFNGFKYELEFEDKKVCTNSDLIFTMTNDEFSSLLEEAKPIKEMISAYEEEQKRIAEEQEKEKQRLAKIEAEKERKRIEEEEKERQRIAEIEAKKQAQEKARLEEERNKIEADKEAQRKAREEIIKQQEEIAKQKAEIERKAKEEKERLEKIEAEKQDKIEKEKAEKEAKKQRLADEKRQKELKPFKENFIDEINKFKTCWVEETHPEIDVLRMQFDQELECLIDLFIEKTNNL